MHRHYQNVNDAFTGLVKMFHQPHAERANIVTNTSRVGEVRMFTEPVTITYECPKERVLFNRARDCNPFFHVFEALWMLAGRNDVAPLAYYNSKIADIASDDGVAFNGAYGYRWRKVSQFLELVDQLKIITRQLKEKPDSRRCVLQMWNVEDDLLRIGHYEPCREPGCVNGMWQNGRGLAMLEEGAKCPICKGTGQLWKNCSKDVCCNTNVYFSLRPMMAMGATIFKDLAGTTRFYALDMTVCNRSNDLIWGMLGANVVHFSFLQEYMAACIGAEVGVYNQFSNNLHAYTAPERWKPEEWLEADEPKSNVYYSYDPPYSVPLVVDHVIFDRECAEFIDCQDRTRRWSEPFLDQVAGPMCLAYQNHKQRDYDKAIKVASNIGAIDWRKACCEWLQRRRVKWESRYA